MGVASCHMINGKRGKLHFTIKRFRFIMCRVWPLQVMPFSSFFLHQLGKSCHTDYKLHFWLVDLKGALPCTERQMHRWAFFQSRPWPPIACKAARILGLLLGRQPAVMGEDSELVIYPFCFTHGVNDFAVIMNCLQGWEVSPLNHCLIGPAGHL